MSGTVYRGEIYHIHRAEAVGHEQRGDRPAVIVSNNMGNEHSPVVEVVYLTTQEKNPLPTHVRIHSTPRVSTALCEQIDSVDKSRLGELLGRVTEDELQKIDKALAVSLEISACLHDVPVSSLIVKKINKEIDVCNRLIGEAEETVLINQEIRKYFEGRKVRLKDLLACCKGEENDG